MGEPVVAIVMGSDSDWPTMKLAAELLKDFNIECEVKVMSAHRTPKKVQTYASAAADAGLKVIIAAAGGAAHLAGVISSFTHLPVIGVPMNTSALGGMDSLLSTVQMPAGVPVATVGVGEAGAVNAAVLAAQVLALDTPKVVDQLEQYRQKLQKEADQKAESVKSSIQSTSA